LRRRLFAALVAATLLLPALVVEPVVAQEGNCSAGSGWRDFAGMENSSSTPSQNRSGVAATMAISPNDFDICNVYGGLFKGVAAWVSISPRDPGPTGRILQVGIDECANGGIWSGDTCQGENNPHFFWAYGDCMMTQPVSQDLGPADYNLHEYAIFKNGNYWYILIDSDIKYILPDPYIGCWSGGVRAASWMGERTDPGDSTGSAGATKVTRFYNAAYGVYNQGWFGVNWTGISGCHYSTSQSRCDTISNNDMDLWTVQ
jgi:hypothetical protein